MYIVLLSVDVIESRRAKYERTFVNCNKLWYCLAHNVNYEFTHSYIGKARVVFFCFFATGCLISANKMQIIKVNDKCCC